MSRSPVVREGGALALISVGAALLYWATNAPYTSPPFTIDPWLYTGAFVNFDFVYRMFHATYYASRLPWVIPGYFLNTFLPPFAAYVVLHVVFFLAGGVFAYLLVRRFLGRTAGFVVYIVLIGSQLYYDSHYWDYPDGAITTFLLGSFYFALTPGSGRRRMVALAAGGFFAGAAVTTNPVSLLFVTGLPILYVATRGMRWTAGSLRALALDTVPFLAGVAALVVGCGVFSRWHDGKFWYVGTQINAARNLRHQSWKLSGYDWLLDEPRLLAPLLVIVCALLVACRRNVPSAVRRFAVGAVAYLVFVELVLIVWEFAFGGFWLDYSYYFDYVFTPLLLVVGATVGGLLARGEHAAGRWVVPAAIVGTALPLLAIYIKDTDPSDDRVGFVVASSIAGVTALAFIATLRKRRLRLSRFSVAALVGAAALAVSTALDASYVTFLYGTSQNVRTYHPSFTLGIRLIDFLRTNRFQDTRLGFWYSASETPYLTGVQSLYFAGFTYVGTDLPRLGPDFAQRVRGIEPQTLVLMCARRACDGGTKTLRSAGLGLRAEATRHLRSGPLQIWVRVFRVTDTSLGALGS